MCHFYTQERKRKKKNSCEVRPSDEDNQNVNIKFINDLLPFVPQKWKNKINRSNNLCIPLKLYMDLNWFEQSDSIQSREMKFRQIQIFAKIASSELHFLIAAFFTFSIYFWIGKSHVVGLFVFVCIFFTSHRLKNDENSSICWKIVSFPPLK